MVTTRTLRVLYHPDRRRILDVLTARGASRVGDIASALDMQVGSVSHHLRMLESEGFVERADDLRTDGRTSWWRSVPRSFAWSVDDFADDGSDAALARDEHRARNARRPPRRHVCDPRRAVHAHDRVGSDRTCLLDPATRR
ncbi:MAG TPA: ArsR family transcriptional regulator [Candidatus Microbacterium stercoravium]|uniref:ArsR family transcriptional regulator n=1 Tax=Candidatus Microbacterium stercoravium TaxID=2838697 RepID=A0A9D2H4S2_9MICO|nr:ArsR family transcriptional regulator [Candidatus Microbacterium stercoravium]